MKKKSKKMKISLNKRKNIHRKKINTINKRKNSCRKKRKAINKRKKNSRRKNRNKRGIINLIGGASEPVSQEGEEPSPMPQGEEPSPMPQDEEPSPMPERLPPLSERYPRNYIDFLSELYIKEEEFPNDSDEYKKLYFRHLAVTESPELLYDIEPYIQAFQAHLEEIQSNPLKKIHKFSIKLNELGIISGHGITSSSSKSTPVFTVVPDGINLLFFSRGGIDLQMASHAEETRSSGISVYPGGSLVEDYDITLYPIVTDSKNKAIKSLIEVGVFLFKKSFYFAATDEEDYDKRLRLETLVDNVNRYSGDGAFQMHAFLRENIKDILRKNGKNLEDYIFDDYDLFNFGTEFGQNDKSKFLTFKLSDILSNLREKINSGQEIPKYFCCLFCRGDESGILTDFGVSNLKKCAEKPESLPTLESSDVFGDSSIDVYDLRRESSLTSSDSLRNFKSIIEELIEYGTQNNETWLDYIKGCFPDKYKTRLFYEEVCYILQLRYKLSLD